MATFPVIPSFTKNISLNHLLFIACTHENHARDQLEPNKFAQIGATSGDRH